MPHKQWATGEEVVASAFNPNVADQVVAVFASAAARGTGWPSPPNGATSFLLDTGSLEVFNAGQWRKPWSAPWGVLGYAQITADAGSFTTIAPVPGLSVPVTHVANRRIRVKCQTLLILASGSYVTSVIQQQMSGATIAVANDTIGRAGDYRNQSLERVHTPGAGAVTYTVNCGTTAGASGGGLSIAAGATYPAFLVVEDIGPNGAPA